MQQITLGGSDLSVSRLCLGTADFGTKITEAESHAMLDAYVDRGGTFLDTARIYSDWVPGEVGRSERIIGDWLAARPGVREEVVIATKGAHPPLEDMAKHRMSRRDIGEDIELSLRSLRVERIDLWYLHRDAPDVPVVEILGSLNHFIEQGKVRAVGCSNWQPGRVREALEIGKREGVKTFVANQMLWNLGSRHMRPPGDKTLHVMNDETLELHREHAAIAAVPYSSQANGFFEKMTSGDEDEIEKAQKSAYHTLGNLRLLGAARAIADERDVSVSAAVLAYLLAQPIATVPIVGTYTEERLDAAMESLTLELTEDEVARLEAAW